MSIENAILALAAAIEKLAVSATTVQPVKQCCNESAPATTESTPAEEPAKAEKKPRKPREEKPAEDTPSPVVEAPKAEEPAPAADAVEEPKSYSFEELATLIRALASAGKQSEIKEALGKVGAPGLGKVDTKDYGKLGGLLSAIGA